MTAPTPPTADRPGRLVLVVGTATEIGKTWTTCAVATHLRASGSSVAARKPAQSFEPGDDTDGVTDAHLLAAATGAAPEEITPPARWYPVPLAPPMAADVLSLAPLTVAEAVAELSWPAGTAIGLLETVGGVRSPIAQDADSVVLAARLRPDLVVLVGHAGLGTIGDVRSAVDALAGHRLVVFLNRFDAANDVHRRNLVWLREHDGFDVVVDIDALARRVAPG